VIENPIPGVSYDLWRAQRRFFGRTNALPAPAGLDPPNGLDGNGATGLPIPIGLLIPTGLFITTGLLITTGLFTKIFITIMEGFTAE
jgi:hypothetical protein